MLRRPQSISVPGWLIAAPPAVFLLAPAARAQVTFSLDWKGPTISQPATTTPIPITEADLLNPASNVPLPGLQPNPRVRYSGAVLGLPLYAGCSGHLPGTPCGIEVDALSEGIDAPFRPTGNGRGRLWFSVDEFAVGVQGTAGFPQVASEALFGDASADLFTDSGLPPGPLGPTPVPRPNIGAIDGDGVPSPTAFAYPGLGLVEPTPATPGPVNAGDNIDGLDLESNDGFPQLGLFFSLDGGFIDALSGVPNSNSAQANGAIYQPGDVLRTISPGATPVRYATAQLLGLDVFGPGTDDLDALILVENGDGVFTPSQSNYDWMGPNPPVDMLMFSVRRGSAVIGKPDSIFGAPIEAGDILVPPRAGGGPFPGIWIAAEQLGLRTSRQSPGDDGDDVDALDLTKKAYFDCNHNGVEDSVDIAVGSSMDANNNGIPDDCESDKMLYCFCLDEYAPCGNGFPYPGASTGCRNSTGNGGLMVANGSTSVGADDLTLVMTQLPANKAGILIMSRGAQTPVTLGDGLLCLTGPVYRYLGTNTGAGGTMTFGPGLVALSHANFPPLGHIAAGNSFYFQGWHRDPQGPCGVRTNMTNAARINFGP